jgi:hypothetical protein
VLLLLNAALHVIQVGQSSVIWSRPDLIEFGPTIVEETKHALHHALLHSSGTSERVGHGRIAHVFEHWRSSNLFSQLIRESIFIIKKLRFRIIILRAEYPLAV